MALTERGLSTQALFLHPKAERNAELWSYLPLPGWISPSEALPGTEVFLEANLDENGDAKVPLLVTRQAGAGKVLYAGFDGTWRWTFSLCSGYRRVQEIAKRSTRPFDGLVSAIVRRLQYLDQK